MVTSSRVPQFASAEWYADPRDHRCPHDAWLEAIEIGELATGDRSQFRTTHIVLRLLGAYHDGHILLRYSGVESYLLGGQSCAQGLGDWLSDEFSVNPSGVIVHHIKWSGRVPRSETLWVIECRAVSYEWIPNK